MQSVLVFKEFGNLFWKVWYSVSYPARKCHPLLSEHLLSPLYLWGGSCTSHGYCFRRSRWGEPFWVEKERKKELEMKFVIKKQRTQLLLTECDGLWKSCGNLVVMEEGQLNCSPTASQCLPIGKEEWAPLNPLTRISLPPTLLLTGLPEANLKMRNRRTEMEPKGKCGNNHAHQGSNKKLKPFSQPWQLSEIVNPWRQICVRGRFSNNLDEYKSTQGPCIPQLPLTKVPEIVYFQVGALGLRRFLDDNHDEGSLFDSTAPHISTRKSVFLGPRLGTWNISCQKIAFTSETFAQIFLYLTAKQYKLTWFAYYVEEKQHVIKVCSCENKHTNKTSPTCDPAEMWQQHRLLCHDLSVVCLPTVYYRSKSETYSAIESLDLHNCFRISLGSLFTFCHEWRYKRVLKRAQRSKMPTASCTQFLESYIEYPWSNLPIYMDFLFPIFVNLISK